MKCLSKTKKGKRCTRQITMKFPWIFCNQHRNSYRKNIGVSTIIITLATALIFISDFDNACNWAVKNTSNFFNNSVECSFDESSPDFKILILPFQEMNSNPEYNIGQEIRNRLHAMDKEEELDINVCYLYDYKFGGNFTEDTAKILQDEYKADLVVFGNYDNKECIENDLICYNWIVAPNWDLDILQGNTKTEYFPSDISEFRKGNLQATTDFIVYWIAGISKYEQKKYGEAKKKFEHILNKFNNVDAGRIKREAYNAAIYCNVLNADFNGAIGLINEVINSKEYENYSSLDSLKFSLATAETYNHSGEFDSSLLYCNQALDILNRNEDFDTKFFSDVYMGLQAVYDKKANYKTSINYGLKALKLEEKNSSFDKIRYGNIVGNLAISYNSRGNSDSSFFYHKKCVKFYESQKPIDDLHLAIACKNFGNFYIKRDADSIQLKKALDLTNRAYQIESRILSSESKYLGHTYNQFAMIFDYMGKFKESLKHHKKSLNIRYNQNPIDYWDIQMGENNIGATYLKMKNYNLALSYICSSYEIAFAKFPDDKNLLIERLINLSVVYYWLKKYEDGEYCIREAFEEAKNLEEDNYLRESILSVMKNGYNIHEKYPPKTNTLISSIQ